MYFVVIWMVLTIISVGTLVVPTISSHLPNSKSFVIVLEKSSNTSDISIFTRFTTGFCCSHV